MKKSNFISIVLTLCCLSSAYASSSGTEFSLNFGTTHVSNKSPNAITLVNSTSPTLSETDSLHGSNGSQDLLVGVDGGYRFQINHANSFLQAIVVGGNLSYLSLNRSGNLYQYQDPKFNNYSFNAKISHYHLLATGSLVFHSLWKTQPYLLFGAGFGANTTNFSTTPKPGIGGDGVSFNTNTKTNFNYEAGIGLLIPIQSRLNIKTQIVYYDFGSAISSKTGDNNVSATTPYSIDLSAFSVEIGLQYDF